MALLITKGSFVIYDESVILLAWFVMRGVYFCLLVMKLYQDVILKGRMDSVSDRETMIKIFFANVKIPHLPERMEALEGFIINHVRVWKDRQVSICVPRYLNQSTC